MSQKNQHSESAAQYYNNGLSGALTMMNLNHHAAVFSGSSMSSTNSGQKIIVENNN